MTRLVWVAACALTFALVAAVIGVSTAMSGASAPTANSVTYQDSTGEMPGAPDVGTVVVSNDDDGLISFATRFTNRSSMGPTEGVWVDIDSDMNPLTGDPPLGFDYSVQFYAYRSSLWRWDATALDWVIAPMSTFRTDWAASTLTVRVNASELGGTSAFKFGIASDANPDDSAAPWDMAPDHLPLWGYEVRLSPVLSVTAIGCTPDPAVKGRAMAARATVVMTRGGKPEGLPATAQVKWTATIGNLRLRPTSSSFTANGVLLSKWRLPKTVKAKSLRVTLTVTVENVTVTKTHVHRVK